MSEKKDTTRISGNIGKRHQPVGRPKFQVSDRVLWKLRAFGPLAGDETLLAEATGMVTDVQTRFAGTRLEKFLYHVHFDLPVFEYPYLRKSVTHLWVEVGTLEATELRDHMQEWPDPDPPRTKHTIGHQLESA